MEFTRINVASDIPTLAIAKEMERILKIGISNEDVTNKLIPFLVKQCYQTTGKERALFLGALSRLAEHGYWKAVYHKDRLDIIIEAYGNKDPMIRSEADFLLYDLIQYESLEEIIDAGLLELTIKNITKCSEFCDNGLFRFCVFGQAGRIIPEVILRLKDDDPVIRRKVVFLLAELSYVNENVADELGALENDRTAHERKIELDMKKLFFNPPFFARSFMPIEEIERRKAQLHFMDTDPIVDAIANSCEMETNVCVRETAFIGLSMMVPQIFADDGLKKSLERQKIVQLCIKALTDENILIRSLGIETLQYIGDRSVIPMMEKLVDDTTAIPPPTPLTPEEVEMLKEEPSNEETIGEVAQKALTRLQKKVKVAEVLKMRKRKGLDKKGQK